MSQKKATRQQTKNHNTRLVFRTIYQQGQISRADIARATGLTRPTVSSIVADLMANDLVMEMGQGPSAGGKRPILLSVAADNRLLLCIDLGSEAFRGALLNLRGEIIQRAIHASEKRGGDVALEAVYALIDDLLARSSTPILGIGVGTPGLIDPHNGIIREAINLGWSDLPLRALLEARYHLPAYVANDSHMVALAEYTFGERRDSENLLVIKVSQGVGAGIVLNGRLYYGDGFGAGEIGHVVTDSDGELCTCGNHGCLETTASTRAILRKAGQIAEQNPDSLLATAVPVDWERLVTAVQEGDAQAKAIVTTAGRHLGIAIAGLIGALNVHNVLISGRITQFGDLLEEAIRDEMRRCVLPAMADETRICFSTFGEEIVILGSSAMILQRELGVT